LKHNLARAKIYELQHHKCGVCAVAFPLSMLVTDHNHMTGIIRGLLCQPCNTIVGSYMRLRRFDRRKSAIENYLRNPPAQTLNIHY